MICHVIKITPNEVMLLSLEAGDMGGVSIMPTFHMWTTALTLRE